MKIDVLTKNVEMTRAIQSYINKKIAILGSLIKRFEKESEVTLFLEIARTTKHHKRGEIFYAEGTLNLSGKTIRAEEYNIDLYSAIDMLKQTLKNDIIKHKNKIVDRNIRKKNKRK